MRFGPEKRRPACGTGGEMSSAASRSKPVVEWPLDRLSANVSTLFASLPVARRPQAAVETSRTFCSSARTSPISAFWASVCSSVCGADAGPHCSRCVRGPDHAHGPAGDEPELLHRGAERRRAGPAVARGWLATFHGQPSDSDRHRVQVGLQEVECPLREPRRREAVRGSDRTRSRHAVPRDWRRLSLAART